MKVSIQGNGNSDKNKVQIRGFVDASSMRKWFELLGVHLTMSWTKPSVHIYGYEVQKEILVNNLEFPSHLLEGKLFMCVLNFMLFLVWSFEWCAGGVFYGSSGVRFSRIIKNVKAPQFLWFLFCSILDKRGAKPSVWFRVPLILDLRGLENSICGLHFPGSSFPR